MVAVASGLGFQIDPRKYSLRYTDRETTEKQSDAPQDNAAVVRTSVADITKPVSPTALPPKTSRYHESLCSDWCIARNHGKRRRHLIRCNQSLLLVGTIIQEALEGFRS